MKELNDQSKFTVLVFIIGGFCVSVFYSYQAFEYKFRSTEQVTQVARIAESLETTRRNRRLRGKRYAITYPVKLKNGKRLQGDTKVSKSEADKFKVGQQVTILVIEGFPVQTSIKGYEPSATWMLFIPVLLLLVVGFLFWPKIAPYVTGELERREGFE